MSGTIDALSERLVAARAAKVEAEEKVTEANKSVDEAETALATEMGSEGLSSFKNSLGSFSLSARVFWSFQKERKEDGLGIIRQVAPDLIKETIHPQTLSAWANEIDRQDAPAPERWNEIKGLLQKFEKPTISIRGVK